MVSQKGVLRFEPPNFMGRNWELGGRTKWILKLNSLLHSKMIPLWQNLEK